jgi:hypothetical protein
MITEETVDAQKAIVVYMKGDFNPASKEGATLVKVIFEDGRVAFGVPKRNKMPRHYLTHSKVPSIGEWMSFEMFREAIGHAEIDFAKPLVLGNFLAVKKLLIEGRYLCQTRQGPGC